MLLYLSRQVNAAMNLSKKLVFLCLLLTRQLVVNAQNIQINWSQCNSEDDYLSCGSVDVPVNWSLQRGEKITLPLKVLRATKSRPDGAVFWLSGGPGQSNMTYTPPASLREKYDVVLVGYRGVDGGIRLSCPEVRKALKGTGNDLLSQSSVTHINKAFGACADRLIQEGIDLEGFTIAQVLKDFEAVRKALGYEKINLLAGSYGTRVSQIYMQQYPEAIDRAILIGTGVPGGFVWNEQMIQLQLNRLNEYCQRDEDCSQVTQNLAQTIDQVLDEAPKRWLLFPIDVGKVRSTTFGMLYHHDTMLQAIDAYLAAASGDYSGIAMMSMAYNFIVPEMMVWGDFLAKGSIDYEPGINYYSLLEENKGSVFGNPFSALFMDAGKYWDAGQTDFDESLPIDHQILILNGTLDFSTPLERIEGELIDRLSSASLISFEGYGHVNDILYRPDVKLALSEFYQSGQAALSPEPGVPDFTVGRSFPRMAKVGLAVVLILVFVFSFLIYRLVRWVKRKARTIKA